MLDRCLHEGKPLRSYAEAMRESIADKMSSAETIAEKIDALYGLVKQWLPDEMEECSHHLDCARAEARLAVDRLRDRLPQERGYISSRVL